MAAKRTGVPTKWALGTGPGTGLWEQHSEAMHAALARHDALLRAVIEEHPGHILRTAGDTFYAVFPAARNAAIAAFAGRAALQAEARSAAWD